MSSDPTREICARIAQLRLEAAGPRGKSLFAKNLDLSPSTYDYYEHDRVPSAEVLVKIADLCKVDLRWLLTGEHAPQGLAVPAGHPAVARAAELLGQFPQAAQPLAAFLDLLAQSLKFPAKRGQRQGGGDETGDKIVSVADAEKAVAGGAAVESISDVVAHNASSASAEIREQCSAAGGEADVKATWIPVLGRSAAGVPQFWKDSRDEAGLTTLGDLIVRYAGSPQRRVCQGIAQAGMEESAVQIITLNQPGSDNVVEFVSCLAIKSRYGDAFAVRIDGESMAPDIRHGDLVVLSSSQRAVDGKAAVVQLARQIGVTCKLYRRQGQTIHLIPINEQFAPQSFAAGQVVWALRVLAKIRP